MIFLWFGCVFAVPLILLQRAKASLLWASGWRWSLCYSCISAFFYHLTNYYCEMQLWDASSGQGFTQFTEHRKRAWSVSFSEVDPTKLASGSDDCCVKVWSINQACYLFLIGTIFLLWVLILNMGVICYSSSVSWVKNILNSWYITT